MNKCVFAAAVLFAALPQISSAAEITGGTVGIGFSQFTDDGDLDKTSATGSLEVGFNRQFSLQGDLAFASFGASDTDANNVALHAIYHAGPATSFGAFAGHDHAEGAGLDYYGLEAGHSYGQFGGEAYVSHAKEDGVSGNLFGLSGRYAVNDAFGVTAGYDHIDVESFDANRTQIGVDYKLGNVTLSGDFGHADGDDLGSSNYVSVGATFAFGPQRRTTFKQRDLIRVIPGL
ncbi:porin [Thioclava sp. F36-6]|uniref:porin n=1 Tax=Thioclava sp. F36-6 TaxID=1915316 RepID=UPI0009D16EA1|nr:porin [Thioclava sp. F36-6]OOY31540.1 hypothetical protein BMI88_10655 [Thioclava sp. F36-6]